VAAGPEVASRIDELIALFNRRSLDLPGGLFDRRTQFLLNGTPFEAMLGRAPDDPLVLMIARGPAGYRFVVKALQHAVPDAQVQRAEERRAEGDADSTAVALRLSGRLRGSGRPIETVLRAALAIDGGTVTRADLALDPALVPLLREARLQE
jgi:hypothetical protein